MASLQLHHINLSSSVVPAMDEFYRALGCEPTTGGAATSRILSTDGYSAPVSFLKSNGIEFHLGTTDLGVGFRMRQSINPVVTGHIAFRTDDIAAVKRDLEARGIDYADYGVWSIAGWHQIFFYDPAGNIVEVHQDLNA